MTESSWIGLLLAATLGALLGAAYLAILWLAIRGIGQTQRAGAWFVAGLVLRLTLVVAGFLGMAV